MDKRIETTETTDQELETVTGGTTAPKVSEIVITKVHDCASQQLFRE